MKIVALDPTHQQGDPNAIQWGWHDRDWGVQNTLAALPIAGGPGETNSLPNSANLAVWHFQDDSVTGRVDITTTVVPPFAGQQASIVQTNYFPQNYVDPFVNINGVLQYVDGPQGIANFSKDLAFALYTTPEPGTFVMMGFGAVVVGAIGWKRRRTR